MHLFERGSHLFASLVRFSLSAGQKMSILFPNLTQHGVSVWRLSSLVLFKYKSDEIAATNLKKTHTISFERPWK